jgi:ubiquitin
VTGAADMTISEDEDHAKMHLTVAEVAAAEVRYS